MFNILLKSLGNVDYPVEVSSDTNMSALKTIAERELGRPIEAIIYKGKILDDRFQSVDKAGIKPGHFVVVMDVRAESAIAPALMNTGVDEGWKCAICHEQNSNDQTDKCVMCDAPNLAKETVPETKHDINDVPTAPNIQQSMMLNQIAGNPEMKAQFIEHVAQQTGQDVELINEQLEMLMRGDIPQMNNPSGPMQPGCPVQ